MSYLFEDFVGWKAYCSENNLKLYEPVLQYEISQKGASEAAIWAGLDKAYRVMKDAVEVGLREDMTSRSGMINNGAKKVYQHPKPVLSHEFQKLISRTLAAKEVKIGRASCRGK